MKPYILFAAACHNGSAHLPNQGTWLETQYVVYSDGTCWTQARFDRECRDGMELPEKREVQTYRLEEQAFSELQQLLQTQFGGIQAPDIYDGPYWQMHQYGPSGAKLCTVRGSVHGVPVLERIEYLLKKRK